MNDEPTSGRQPSTASPGFLITLSGRLRRLALGTVAVGINQVINLTAQVLLVPLFLRAWGVELYGEWLTLSAAVAFLAVLDFGMQMYVVNLLHRHYVQGNLTEYTRTLHSALSLSVMIAMVSLLILGFGLAVAPLEQWFNLGRTDHGTAWWAMVLLGAQVLATTFQGMIGGVYRSVGRFPRGMMVINVQRLVTIGATVSLLLTGGGLVLVALAQLVPALGSLIYIWWDVRRYHPDVSLGFRHGRLAHMAAFIGPSLFFFMITLSQTLALQGSVLILGATLGAGVLTTFVAQRTLANVIRQAISAINSALTPEIGALAAEGDYALLRNLHLLTVKIATLLSLCAATWLHFAGHDLMMLWTEGRIVFDPRLMDALLLLLVTQTPWLTSSVLLSATNKHRRLTVAYTASGIMGVALGWWWSSKLGAIGMVLGLWVADLLICGLWIPLHACRSIQESIRRYAFEVAVRALPATAALLVAGYGLSVWVRPFTEGGAWIIVSAVAIGVVGAVTAYASWLSSTERQRIRLGLKLATSREEASR